MRSRVPPLLPPPQFRAPSTPFLAPCPLWGPFGPSLPVPSPPCADGFCGSHPRLEGCWGSEEGLKRSAPLCRAGSGSFFFFFGAFLSGLSLVGTILGALAGCCWSRRLLVLAGLSDAFRARFSWHCLAQTGANKFLCANPVKKDRANCQPAPTNP